MNNPTCFFKSLSSNKPFVHRGVEAFMKYLNSYKGYPKNLVIFEPDENHTLPALGNDKSGEIFERYEVQICERIPAFKEMILLGNFLDKKGMFWVIAKITLTKADNSNATSFRVKEFFTEQNLITVWRSSFTVRIQTNQNFLPAPESTGPVAMNNFNFSPLSSTPIMMEPDTLVAE